MRWLGKRYLLKFIMTIDKEIRGVALLSFLKTREEVEAVLNKIETEKSVAVIRYSMANSYDATCMVISVDGRDIAYVNVDDKRYVSPLLKEARNGTCEAEFLEVYRPEKGTPIVRFLVTVDLEDVEKLQSGKQWDDWDYDGLQLLRIGNVFDVDFCAACIMKAVQKGKDGICEETTQMIEKFAEASLIDMSVETTWQYDNILFLLETRHRAVWRDYINMLQHASTVRRTDGKRNVFTQKWWPEFLESEAVNRLCKEFGGVLAKNGEFIGKNVLRKHLKMLNKELMQLPYNLHLCLDDMEELWSVLYYTQIPRDKFHKLLSALALRDRLQRAVDGNMPLIVNNLTLNNKTELNFLKDSNAVVNTY